VPPKEVETLKSACTFGQVNEVHGILSYYLMKHPVNPYTGRPNVSIFRSSLQTAVKLDRPVIVSYLLFNRIGEDCLPVYEAVQSASLAVFQVFLDYGWNINEPRGKLHPPALAMTLNRPELVEWFLDHGADPNARCALDYTTMSVAVFSAPLAIFERLLERGGNIYRGQLLHYVAYRNTGDEIELVRRLLDFGLPIDAIKYEDDLPSYKERAMFGLGTALHRAAEFGKVDLVKYLLERGADRTIRDTKGKTALYWAEHRGHTEIIELLQ